MRLAIRSFLVVITVAVLIYVFLIAATREARNAGGDGMSTLTAAPALVWKSAEFHGARATLDLVRWTAAHPPAPRWSADWHSISRCETGGNWQMQGSTYSGGLGFANTTWRGYGGLKYAPNAGQATPYQQMLVAENVYDEHGLSGWGCRRYG